MTSITRHFASCLTLHTAGERSMKTEEHGDYSDCSHFLVQLCDRTGWI